MRLIFAGTPDFAAVALEALIRAGHEIALVLSQPDRPSGRGMKLTASPVKTLALQHGLPVLTPQTLSLKRDPEGAAAVHETLRNLEADVLIVAAYGLILPAPVLECAKGIGRDRDIRAINIHGSLLPRWRGAAPVARAIEAGDAETGVTLMKMELGLDTGPMISVRSTPIISCFIRTKKGGTRFIAAVRRAARSPYLCPMTGWTNAAFGALSRRGAKTAVNSWKNWSATICSPREKAFAKP